MICLTGARFTMQAEILRKIGPQDTTDSTNTNNTPNTQGSYENYQDPITGAILEQWVPAGGEQQDNPDTPDVYEDKPRTINCLARGIVDGGIRVAGTTERFGDTYENIDYVKMWVPANVKITKRDRVTNIRNKNGGQIIWIDEETDGEPTVFNVNGVTPLFDAFNKHTENYVLLEKA